MNRSRGREWLGRVGLVVFGFALAVVAIEAGLQLGGLVVAWKNEGRRSGSWTTGNLRVLCLGDSNTFGLNLEREEAYPHQLELLWNEHIAAPKIEVVNMGFPGMNSTRLIRDVDRMWSALAPDVVLLMIGVNDFWTDPLPWEAGDEPSFWRRHSRLYRLGLLLGRGASGEVEVLRDRDGAVRLRVAGEDFEVDARASGRGRKQATVERDLLELIDRIRDRGSALHLMTYPARTRLYALANPIIRKAATRSRVPLVDLAEVFDRVCPEQDCPALMFEDNHPTRAGYQVVAEALIAHLAPSLAAGKAVPR